MTIDLTFFEQTHVSQYLAVRHSSKVHTTGKHRNHYIRAMCAPNMSEKHAHFFIGDPSRQVTFSPTKRCVVFAFMSFHPCKNKNWF